MMGAAFNDPSLSLSLSSSSPSCLYMRVRALVGAFFYAGDAAVIGEHRGRAGGRGRWRERGQRQPAGRRVRGGILFFFSWRGLGYWRSFWIGSLSVLRLGGEETETGWAGRRRRATSWGRPGWAP